MKEANRSTVDTARESAEPLPDDHRNALKKKAARAHAATAMISGRVSACKPATSNNIYLERPFEIQIVDIAEKNLLREEGITGVGLRTEGRLLRQHSPRRRAVTHARHGDAGNHGRNKREAAVDR